MSVPPVGKFADKCDMIHIYMTCNSFPCLDNTCQPRKKGNCNQTETGELETLLKDGAKLRQDIETVRKETARLRAALNDHRRQFTSLNTNNRHLLEIEDINEEVDVDRVVRVEKVNNSGTCLSFPCMDKTYLKH